MANVLGELFQDIADAIRSKTGSTDTLKPNQFPEAIEGITTGGGSSADVRYVTFMNGTEVLYKKPVAVGDDCVDVLQKGLIETPTKASTTQYNYTFYGWGASDGGAADANILKNITEDKTVYAIFTATAVPYTITFYDEDGTTVLATKQVPYGTVPSYTPTKDGKVFGGWNPEPVPVTGDATYTATWVSVLATGSCGANTRYELSSDYTLTISGTGATSNWSSSSSNRPPWYNSYNSKIKKVVVREGVTAIGDYALYNSSVLTEVVISSTVTSIGASAFNYCPNVESVSIPSTSKLTSILGAAFSGCSKMDITIPSGVTNYGGSAFYKCNKITDVTISSGTTLGTSVFRGCTGLQTAEIHISTIPTSTFNGCTALANVTIGDSVTVIDDSAFYGCKALSEVVIPPSVTTINQRAFQGCTALTEVVIPPSVTTINQRAFYGCNALTTVTIGNSVTSLGAGVFNACPALVDINVADGNTAYCVVDDVLYDIGVTALIRVPVNYAGSFVVPSTVTRIEEAAFYSCKTVTSVDVPDAVTYIGTSAFHNCNTLSSFSIPSNITTIEGYTFSGCSALNSITIPASVTSIKSYAFQNTGLTSATFEITTGWSVNNTNISSSLTNKSTAANYLKERYYYYDWTRK